MSTSSVAPPAPLISAVEVLKRTTNRRPAVLPLLVGATVAALWSVLGIARQMTGRTGIDLGLYGESVERYANGQLPWSSLKSSSGHFNLLGDHFTPLVAIIAPVYRIYPHVETLLVAQAICIGLAAGLLTQTGNEIFGSATAAVLFASAFGVSWGVAGLALFDFHEYALALPILALALRHATYDRWRTSILWALPLVLVKEDCGFLLAGLGLAAYSAGRRKLGVLTTVAGAASFLAIAGIIIPKLSYSGRYTYWSTATPSGNASRANLMSSLAINLVHSLTSPAPWVLVGAVLLAVLFLPVRSSVLWVAVPSLLARFATDHPSYWQPAGHYNSTLMVVTFFAAADAWSRFQPAPSAGNRRTRNAKIFASTVLATNLMLSWWSPLRLTLQPDFWSCSQICADSARIAGEIPAGASVIASTYIVDQLIDRTDVHLASPNLRDSNGHPEFADYVIVRNDDPGVAPSGDFISYAIASGFVPVDAAASGVELLMWDPAGAQAYYRDPSICRVSKDGWFCTSVYWHPKQMPSTSLPPRAP